MKPPLETGISFELAAEGTVTEITATGIGAHASTPDVGNNALTGLLVFLGKLDFASCPQVDMVRKTASLFPHGDVNGKTLGVAMEDELSGNLTLSFNMLSVDAASMDGEFDGRIPVCGNDENVLEVVRARMAEQGLTLLNKALIPPHHVSADSYFVKTLLAAFELYTGRKGECQALGGGTYVHHLENGVAFGAAMPETDNKMHGPDEFAVVDELLVSAKIFAQAIVDLCG